jgi:hypothetical protein
MRQPPYHGVNFESDGDGEAYFNPQRLLFANRNVDTNISSQLQIVPLDSDVHVTATADPTDLIMDNKGLIIQLPEILLPHSSREILKSSLIVINFLLNTIMLTI